MISPLSLVFCGKEPLQETPPKGTSFCSKIINCIKAALKYLVYALTCTLIDLRDKKVSAKPPEKPPEKDERPQSPASSRESPIHEEEKPASFPSTRNPPLDGGETPADGKKVKPPSPTIQGEAGKEEKAHTLGKGGKPSDRLDDFELNLGLPSTRTHAAIIDTVSLTFEKAGLESSPLLDAFKALHREFLKIDSKVTFTFIPKTEVTSAHLIFSFSPLGTADIFDSAEYITIIRDAFEDCAEDDRFVLNHIHNPKVYLSMTNCPTNVFMLSGDAYDSLDFEE